MKLPFFVRMKAEEPALGLLSVFELRLLVGMTNPNTTLIYF